MKLSRSFSALLVFVCIAPWLAASSVPALADQTDYDRAVVLFNSKDFAGVVKLLDPFLKAHPTDSRALVLRGDSKASLDDDVGALKDYDAAIVANPDYQYAYATRCDTRRNIDQLDEALADCNKAIQLDPKDPLAYEYRGNISFDRAAYDAAVNDYDRSIELGRQTADVYAERCNAERLAGKMERAPADCEKALSIDPQDRWAHWARGRLYLTENKYAEAIVDLSTYIAQRPKSSDNAYYFRGIAYDRSKSFTLGLADEQTYIDRHPQDADAHAERAVARYNLGDKSAAAADLQIALKGYREAGDTDNVARVQGMISALKAGGSLP